MNRNKKNDKNPIYSIYSNRIMIELLDKLRLAPNKTPD